LGIPDILARLATLEEETALERAMDRQRIAALEETIKHLLGEVDRITRRGTEAQAVAMQSFFSGKPRGYRAHKDELARHLRLVTGCSEVAAYSQISRVLKTSDLFCHEHLRARGRPVRIWLNTSEICSDRDDLIIIGK
jgi:hypothetical protein